MAGGRWSGGSKAIVVVLLVVALLSMANAESNRGPPITPFANAQGPIPMAGHEDLTHARVVRAIASAVPTVALVNWTSWNGYSLPIPRDWTRHENYTSGGSTSDLFLEGTYNGTSASLLVGSTQTAGVQETRPYLSQYVNDTVSLVRERYPSVVVSGETFERLSGHGAVVFVLHYGSSVYQDFAFVASEPHERTWLIILTAAPAEEHNLNGTFDQILQGFLITAAVPAAPTLSGLSTIWILAIGIVAVAAIGVTAVVLLLRARRKSGGRSPPPPGGGPGSGSR